MPYAVEVDGQFISVFDPVVHKPVADQPKEIDQRWMLCDRPCIIVGGELVGNMLDLAYQVDRGVYLAPIQMQANNGILVIDDFGRQTLTPEQLLKDLGIEVGSSRCRSWSIWRSRGTIQRFGRARRRRGRRGRRAGRPRCGPRRHAAVPTVAVPTVAVPTASEPTPADPPAGAVENPQWPADPFEELGDLPHRRHAVAI